jgi:hypothetical protein
MIEVAPITVHVVNNGLDWASIAASISTGAAAVAGIGATLWATGRAKKNEERHARLADKRRIYSEYLSALSAARNADRYLRKLADPGDLIAAEQKLLNAKIDCTQAFMLLSLIATEDIISSGVAADQSISKDAYPCIIGKMIKLMRKDIGELPFSGDAAAMVNQPAGN